MKNYRTLTAEEVAILKSRGNRADEWAGVLVAEPFVASKLYGNRFCGEVRLGSNGDAAAEIEHSMLKDCTVGDNCRIDHVLRLEGYTIGNSCVLFNIGELVATAEGALPQMAPMNENGGRRIAISRQMTTGMAYIWAKYRGNGQMTARFEELARRAAKEAPIGNIGDHATVRNCQSIKNVAVESSEAAPTEVANAIELEDGVIGYGCKVGSGVVAKRFMTGENVKLLDGLRLTDSVVGDNSTLAGAEVTSAMIFPAHEQHHSSSFLIAAAIEGQSNVAAGDILGSNHNSRGADGELVAGRGFWPALATSLKHSSRFASFCLVAKGDYPYELNIPLPFALVNNNVAKSQLEIMPAYWWMYNMYALLRNEGKYTARDHRHYKNQHIEFSPLAPDTAEEIVNARKLLKYWTEQAYNPALLRLLPPEERKVEITAQGLENSKRKVLILKAGKAYKAYEEMLVYYAMKVLTNKYDALPPESLGEGERDKRWVNIGGQLLRQEDLEDLAANIDSYSTWGDMAKWLDARNGEYEALKCRHAYKMLCDLLLIDSIGKEDWSKLVERYNTIKEYIAVQQAATRLKDYQNPFKQSTFASEAEMRQVLGLAVIES